MSRKKNPLGPGIWGFVLVMYLFILFLNVGIQTAGMCRHGWMDG